MNLLTRCWFFFLVYLVTLPALPIPAAQAGPEEELSKGQLVYVPVYSHVYHGDYERKILLTGILKLAM